MYVVAKRTREEVKEPLKEVAKLASDLFILQSFFNISKNVCYSMGKKDKILKCYFLSVFVQSNCLDLTTIGFWEKFNINMIMRYLVCVKKRNGFYRFSFSYGVWQNFWVFWFLFVNKKLCKVVGVFKFYLKNNKLQYCDLVCNDTNRFFSLKPYNAINVKSIIIRNIGG